MSIVNRYKTNSSNIKDVGYDPEAKTLEVTFMPNEKTYRYENVSADDYVKLLNAESIGGHFGQTLKKSHKGTPIDLMKGLKK